MSRGYLVWIRIDHETRMRRGNIHHGTIEEAHAYAAAHFGGRAYEIDLDDSTVFACPAAEAMRNRNQYRLFG